MLSQPVGLGLAGRGSVRDVVRWANRAERLGLESVWFHESYFERDAVTYATAVAQEVPNIGVALGALSPLVRHSVLTAMTISALDDLAPGRITCALASALPLRLQQMDIPYDPDAVIGQLEQAMHTMKALWRNERLRPKTPGVPDLAAMFPPVHEVPIYIAGYRKAMVELAGRLADGYLARPAESLGSISTLIARLRDAEATANRAPGTVRSAGYLMSYLAPTTREALNRAKREPFVIYMISVLSNLALERAQLPTSLRDEVRAAWRAEDYHRAAAMIPDELLQAFFPCGTVEDVAARAWEYHETGLDLPIIQPVVQEDDQVQMILEAARLYGEGSAGTRETGWPAREVAVADSGVVPAEPHVAKSSAPSALVLATKRLARHASSWWEIARPFSLTATLVPVGAATALAATNTALRWTLVAGVFLAALCIQLATNIINEIEDVRHGVDSITTPRASQAILKGRVSERAATIGAGIVATTAVALGGWLIYERGWPIALLGLVGLIGGVGYTAPPLQLKYRAMGPPVVFLLMGPVMVEGAYWTITGKFSGSALALSFPVGLLVTAILQGNEWRDIADDARAGISTIAIKIGPKAAGVGYIALVTGAYLALTGAVLAKAVPLDSLIAMASLPLMVYIVRAGEAGERGDKRALAKIDLMTARLHALFGALLVVGVALAGR
jgi:1,4-dihydroxy-2-naphthoate octaprenyltransferase